jgi:hypothetical protein
MIILRTLKSSVNARLQTRVTDLSIMILSRWSSEAETNRDNLPRAKPQ